MTTTTARAIGSYGESFTNPYASPSPLLSSETASEVERSIRLEEEEAAVSISAGRGKGQRRRMRHCASRWMKVKINRTFAGAVPYLHRPEEDLLTLYEATAAGAADGDELSKSGGEG